MEQFRIISEQEHQEEKEALEKKASEEIGRTEKALEAIDHDVLKDVFFDVLTPAEAEDAWRGFLPMSSVHVVYDSNLRSRGRFSSKVDRVDEAHIVLNAEKFGKTSPEDFELSVLYTYVHEQVHALSTDFRVHKGYGEKDKSFLGFKKTEKDFKDKDGEISYVELNEGMTEIIAEEVAREYLRRTGEVPGKQRDTHHAQNSIAVYMDYKILVDDIVAELAQRYGQPSEIIKKAMIRAYFSKKSPEDNFTDWLKGTHSDLAEKALNIAQNK